MGMTRSSRDDAHVNNGPDYGRGGPLITSCPGPGLAGATLTFYLRSRSRLVMTRGCSRVCGVEAGVVLDICAIYRIALRGALDLVLDLLVFHLVVDGFSLFIPFAFWFMAPFAFSGRLLDSFFTLTLSLFVSSPCSLTHRTHRLTQHPCETFPSVFLAYVDFFTLLHSYISTSCSTTYYGTTSHDSNKVYTYVR
jgi:hypothetical protein